ncbi:hypothetical protein, partial [Candidatus Thiosymbion oneisti]|uniref:hypothetical protein n=1 Tax=Candidatus Thiosymbion oneisti TaxID=589554 RepID=UPI001A9C984B
MYTRMLDTGLMLSAARSFQLPTQRVGTRKTASDVTFYDTPPPGGCRKSGGVSCQSVKFKPQR